MTTLRIRGWQDGLLALVVMTVWLVLAAGQLRAQEPHAVGDGEEEASGDQEESLKNVIVVFVGVTAEEEAEAFTLGLDYERRLSERFGIGVLTDYAFGDARTFIIGLPVFLHVTERLQFIVAAGLEKGSHGTESLVRLGVEYEFDMGRVGLSPALYVDFVRGEEILVFGVNVGHRF